jgi:hypothetical protein
VGQRDCLSAAGQWQAAVQLALSTVVGMLAFNQLPMLFHPLFNSTRFERVTDDGFFISIEAWDRKFDAVATERFLTQIGAAHVELIRRQPAALGRQEVGVR